MLIWDYLSFEHERVWPVCELRSRADGQEAETAAPPLLYFFLQQLYPSGSSSGFENGNRESWLWFGKKMVRFFWGFLSTPSRVFGSLYPPTSTSRSKKHHPLLLPHAILSSLSILPRRFFPISIWLIIFHFFLRHWPSLKWQWPDSPGGWVATLSVCLGWRTGHHSHPTKASRAARPPRRRSIFVVPLSFTTWDLGSDLHAIWIGKTNKAALLFIIRTMAIVMTLHNGNYRE